MKRFVFLIAFALSVAALPAHAQSFTTLATFNNANGGKPIAILQGADGNF